MLTTRQKITIAKVASFGLRGVRGLAGRGAEVEATRMGIRWALDLREGIDLGIYLGQYQTVPGRLIDLLRDRPSCTIVDIGANVGAFTLPFAQAVRPGGNVVAFEPTAFAFNKLQHNLKLNPSLANQITLVQAMLDDGTAAKTEAATLYSSWRLDGVSNKGEHPLHGGSLKDIDGAAVTSLDAFVAENQEIREKVTRLALIKLDVDGYELPILRGARETIAAARPMLLIEIAPHVQESRREGLAGLLGELDRQGFKLYDPITGKTVNHIESELQKLIKHGASKDLLGMLDG